ncbi:Mitochondrial ribosomal protein S36 [Mactra antiquata]
MTTVARTIQAVRPHIPMIKFPNRTAEASKGVTGNMVQSFTESTPSSTQSSRSQSISGSGLDSVPLKYRRRLISPEEMAFIERGGPE